MKAPQDRKSAKFLRDRSETPFTLKLDGNDNSISLTEIENGTKRPPMIIGREEVKLVRDWCEAWLDANGTDPDAVETPQFRKAPQERSTAKKYERQHNMGYPPIEMGGNAEYIRVTEVGEGRWPPIFRGVTEIAFLREWCEAWLDADSAD